MQVLEAHIAVHTGLPLAQQVVAPEVLEVVAVSLLKALHARVCQRGLLPEAWLASAGLEKLAAGHFIVLCFDFSESSRWFIVCEVSQSILSAHA